MSVVDFASSQQLTPAAIRITPRSPEEINWEMQQVQLGIARRAYELFLARGCEHGHDWEDWFPRSTRQKHFWTCEPRVMLHGEGHARRHPGANQSFRCPQKRVHERT